MILLEIICFDYFIVMIFECAKSFDDLNCKLDQVTQNITLKCFIHSTNNEFYNNPNNQFVPKNHIETNLQFVPSLYCVAVNSCGRTPPEALRSTVTTACDADLFTLANCQLYVLLYSLFIGHVTDTSRQPISVQRVEYRAHHICVKWRDVTARQLKVWNVRISWAPLDQ